jgi:hypothetical protein
LPRSIRAVVPQIWLAVNSGTQEPMPHRFVRPGMRFTVRKVAQSWMVWDTAARSVAEVDEMPAIGISEKTAQRFADMLNSQHDIRDRPQRR